MIVILYILEKSKNILNDNNIIVIKDNKYMFWKDKSELKLTIFWLSEKSNNNRFKAKKIKNNIRNNLINHLNII